MQGWPSHVKKNAKKNLKIFLTSAAVTVLLIVVIHIFFTAEVRADTGLNLIDIISGDSNEETATTVQIILLLTVLTLAPSILVMMTSFTRIIIVLSFTRNAMGTQQMPPNQVLIGLALFLTLFIMSPVIADINTQAYEPLKAGEITQQEFFKRAEGRIRNLC